MKCIRNIVLLAGLLALVAAGPGLARAQDSDRIQIGIEYVNYAYGDPEPPGSFKLSGAYEDSGTCTLEGSVENADGSFTQVHELVGADGTLTVQVDISVEFWGFFYTSRRVGRFTVLSGTEAYADLEYEGDTLLTSTTSNVGWGGWGYTYSYTTVVYELDSDPPENVAPVAHLSSGPYGTDPYSYNLMAWGSWDEDGIPVAFEWDFDGDGTWDAATQGVYGASITHTYPGTGTWTAAVRVTDNDGATDTATHQVVITPPPSVSITAPANGSTVSGTSVAIGATVTNAITAYFHVDGILVGTQASGQPSGTWYASVLWDSTTVANGTHTFTVTAVSA
ncbi:MAG: PKD domain-containing protein, partial [Planctomycetota bacterium]